MVLRHRLHSTTLDSRSVTEGALRAEMGGADGRTQAKNLIDVVRTLVMGMELDVLLKLNKNGTWAGSLIDPKSGMLAPLPLNQDMLPCLPLTDGEKFQWQSKPDSLDDLVERYKRASKSRSKRLGRKVHYQAYPFEAQNFSSSGKSGDEESSEDDALRTEEELNAFLQEQWANENRSHSALAGSRKRPARVLKEKIVHTSSRAHDLLHRPATETRRALAAQEGVVFETDSGEKKSGPESLRIRTSSSANATSASSCGRLHPLATRQASPRLLAASAPPRASPTRMSRDAHGVGSTACHRGRS